MSKPTMREIGKAVGVSAVTVSKAMSGKPGVSDEVREKIRSVADEMGYAYPSQGKKLDIGILVPEHFFERESFYSAMYRMLVKKLADRGHFGLLELLSRETEKALALPKLMESRKADGLILLGEPDKAYYRKMAREGIPVIFLDFYDEQGSADAIVGDNAYGEYRLTSHLIKNGHTRIGFVGNYRATSSIMDRYLGYYRAMLSHDLPIREDWILKDRDDEGILRELELPCEMPTAFVCNCDLVAQKLIRLLTEKGYRVPEDVSITGYDDFYSGLEAGPELSTFRVDTGGMIDEAVHLMEARCAGLKKPFGRTVISGEPVYRASERPLKSPVEG